MITLGNDYAMLTLACVRVHAYYAALDISTPASGGKSTGTGGVMDGARASAGGSKLDTPPHPLPHADNPHNHNVLA